MKLKHKLILFSVFAFIQADAQFMLNPRWSVSSNFGMCFQMLPTRMNTETIDNNSINNSKFSGDTQYTIGLIGELNLCPIKTDYFAYEFIPTISLNWLGKQTGSNRIFSNQFTAGYSRFWAVLGKQNAYKQASVNWYQETDYNTGVKYRNISNYRSTRTYFGIRYLYGDDLNNQIEIGLSKEKFNLPYKLNSNGYSIRWTIKQTLLTLEYFPKHMADGQFLIAATPFNKPKDLPATGMYFQFSIRGKISFTNSYGKQNSSSGKRKTSSLGRHRY